jgi:HEAT repeat protein
LILPIATDDPEVTPVDVVAVHPPFQITATTPAQIPELPAETEGGQPGTPAELLAWCERQMRVLADRVRAGGAWAANHDPVIHRIGREADALARAFCPPELVLSLPQVPVTFPHVYDHHKALTVLHRVAEWCRTQPAVLPAPEPGQTLPRPSAFPLCADACDRVVVVEDQSDETYLRWWMEKVLPPEQWERISAEVVFLHTGGRPTGDDVNQKLDTILRTHPDGAGLQPRAFVIADRDYRLDEELQAECDKLSRKAFARQTWKVWQERVEIESYLLCTAALVRHVMDLAKGAPAGPRFPSPREDDVRALIEEAVEASRSAARNQLVNSFARVKKGQVPSTWVIDAERHLNGAWQGDGRLRWCDAKEVVLPRLKGECKRRWNLALSERALIRSLRPEEVPADVVQVVQALASFLSASYWLTVGSAEREAVRPLVEALRSKSGSIRRTAVEALGEKGRAGLPALSKALQDEEAEVRRAAAWSLVRIGRQAAPATPALAKALRDDDPEVRQRVAVALGYIGPLARTAVPALLDVLANDKAWEPRRNAATALGRIGETGEVVPSLITALPDPDTNVRMAAAEALGLLGAKAAEAVPALLRMITDMSNGREGVRQQAAFALGKIGQATPDVVQALAAALKDPHRDPRRFAARGLGRLYSE